MGFSIKEKDGKRLIKRNNGFYLRCGRTNEIISVDDLLDGWDGDENSIAYYVRVDSDGNVISKAVSDTMVRCDNCKRFESPSNIVENNGKKLCHSCMSRFYRKCADCGRWFRRDSGFVHEYCIDETTDPENREYSYRHICNDCIKTYTRCQECGNFTKTSYIKRNKKLCGYCFKNVLKSYHYTNDPVYGMPFLGAETRKQILLMGVELEATKGGRNNRNAIQIADIMGHDYVTICRDGSIGDGFELISCPANLKNHLTMLHWKEALEKLKELGYVSHDGGACGLHVHLDREYFSGMNKDEYEGKFFVTLRNNKEWIKTFSRRFAYNYCKINGYEHSYDASDDNLGRLPYPPTIEWINKKKQYERHMALNFENRNTVEIRIFRGTLNYETFVATLQMVVMWAEFVKRLSMDECIGLNLKHFINKAHNLGYREFIHYIQTKNIIDNPTPTGE